MSVTFGKGDNLCLYTWAVSRTDTLYLSVVKRRVVEAVMQNLVYFGVCVAAPAWKLLQITTRVAIRKFMKIIGK